MPAPVPAAAGAAAAGTAGTDPDAGWPTPSAFSARWEQSRTSRLSVPGFGSVAAAPSVGWSDAVSGHIHGGRCAVDLGHHDIPAVQATAGRGPLRACPRCPVEPGPHWLAMPPCWRRPPVLRVGRDAAAPPSGGNRHCYAAQRGKPLVVPPATRRWPVRLCPHPGPHSAPSSPWKHPAGRGLTGAESAVTPKLRAPLGAAVPSCTLPPMPDESRPEVRPCGYSFTTRQLVRRR